MAADNPAPSGLLASNAASSARDTEEPGWPGVDGLLIDPARARIAAEAALQAAVEAAAAGAHDATECPIGNRDLPPRVFTEANATDGADPEDTVFMRSLWRGGRKLGFHGLAQLLAADPTLIIRLTRHLTAMRELYRTHYAPREALKALRHSPE